MKSRKLRIGMFLLLVASVSATPLWARDLILAEVQPPTHLLVKSEEVLASRLGQLTNGALIVQIKHSSQLGNEDSVWKAVRTGSLDLARVNIGTLVSEISAAKILSLPYLFRSREHLWSVLGGDFGQRLRFEIAKNDAILLGYYDSGSRSFYMTKKPIRFYSDFAGQNIRVQNSPIAKDLITMLSGTPIVMSYDKVIDAFKDGSIDGAENNLTSYVATEHYKYARYLSLDEHTSAPEVLLMSKKAWESLTPEQKTAMNTAVKESSDYMRRLWTESEAQALAKARKEGVMVIEKSQIGMNGIEAFATKLYSKYTTDVEMLQTILAILSVK